MCPGSQLEKEGCSAPPTPLPPKELEARSLTPWAHTPALTIPHFFLLHPRVGGRTSGPSYPALPSLHSSASTGTQVSSLQPSQAGCCFMPRVPLLSRHLWRRLGGAGDSRQGAWGRGAAPGASFLSPAGCSSDGCQRLSSGLSKCLGDS